MTIKLKVQTIFLLLFSCIVGFTPQQALAVTDLNTLSSVDSSSLQSSFGGVSYNRRSGAYNNPVILTNISAVAVDNIQILAIEGLSIPNDSVNNESDTATTGEPLFNLGGITLAPGEAITVNVIIVNTTRTRINFTATVYQTPIVTDTTPPSLSVITPSNGNLVTDARRQIQLQFSDDGGIDQDSLGFSIDGVPFDVTCVFNIGNVVCTPIENYPEGLVTLQTVLSDLAGNTATVETSFTVDSGQVEISISSPANEFITKEAEITVDGTVGVDVESVKVNDVAAIINGSAFIVTVPLREGKNMIVAVGTKASGKTGTDTVDITRDIVAPIVRIQTPVNQFNSAENKIAVAGLVNDIVNGGQNAKVLVNGIEATVANGAFMVIDLPLVRGPNTITAIATDAVGNVGQHSITVNFQEPVGARLLVTSGNGQAGVVNSQLDQPLIVSVKDDLGNPVAARMVKFVVTRNSGTLQSNGSTPVRVLQTPTNGSGQATVQFNLGDTTGEGNNRVVVSALGVTGEIEFCATGLPSPAQKILMVEGDNQRGTINNPLASPLEALVVDKDGNPINDINVTFKVLKGNGTIDGVTEFIRATGTDGIVRAVLTLGTEPGINNNVVSATFPGLTTAAATFVSSGLAPGKPEDTKFRGVVLGSGHNPIPGAVITIADTVISEVTDAEGQFLLNNVPVGHIHLQIDPTNSPRPETFPKLDFETVTVAGQINILGQPIIIPFIQTEGSKLIGGDEDVTISMPGVAGLNLTVFANSATFSDGSKTGQLTISQVHLDKVPMPPPSGTIFMPPAWTIQPAGTLFDPPARISIPNDGLPPGRVIDIFQFDHTLNEFINVGKGTVSDDGLVIVSDPGFGITRAGWGGCGQPQPPTTCTGKTPACKKCDESNGSFVTDSGKNDTKCVDSDVKQSIEYKGVTINIDDSCKGECKDGSCKETGDNFKVSKLVEPVNIAIDKSFSECITRKSLKDELQKKLKDKGVLIKCEVDKVNPGCGFAPNVPGNTFVVEPAGFDPASCGPLALTILHEMMHSHGGENGDANHNDGPNNTDVVYGCETACFPKTGTGNKDACK